MYKKGEIVKFKSNLVVDVSYNGIDWTQKMNEEYLGQFAVVDEFDESDNTFTILMDRTNGCWYSIEMLD